MSNIYETSARQVKVTALVDFFTRKAYTVDEIKRLDDSGWRAACLLVGVRPASSNTRAAVIAALEVPEYVGDPFAGFPGCNQ
jgi:hypothetical protein